MQVIPTKTDGVSTLPAAEFNQIPLEISNAITASGITPSSGDAYQLSKGMANYAAVGQYYVDSGTANAKVLSVGGSRNGITAYVTGTVIRFLNLVQNTGATTVNVNGLGVKDLTDADANALKNEDLVTNAFVEAYYDGTRFRLTDNRYKGAITLSASATLDTTYLDRTVMVDVSGGSVVATLPAVSVVSQGSTITFVRQNAASNNVMRIRGSGGTELIGNKTSLDFYGHYDSVTVRRAGTQWFVTAVNMAPVISGAYSGASTTLSTATLTTMGLATAGVTGGSGVGTALSTGFVDLTNEKIFGLIPGWYFATAAIEFVANSTGYREVRIAKNGTTPYATTVVSVVSGTDNEIVMTSGYFYMNGSSDYLQIIGRQTSGGNLNGVPQLNVMFLGREYN